MFCSNVQSGENVFLIIHKSPMLTVPRNQVFWQMLTVLLMSSTECVHPPHNLDEIISQAVL